MKKVTGIFMIILLLHSGITRSYAVNKDETAPSINQITMDKSSVSAGETVEFEFDTEDDLSGTNNIMIEWKLRGTDGKDRNHLVKEFRNISSDKFKDLFKVPENVLPGVWETSAIQIWDAEMNLRTYVRDSQLNKFDISVLDLTINNEKELDTIVPVINSIRIVEENYDAPYVVTIEADIIDNVSENIKAQINYSTVLPEKIDYSTAINGIVYNEPKGISTSASFTKNENGKYYAKINVENRYLKFLCIYIRVEDSQGNYAYYTQYSERLKEIYGNYNYKEFYANLDIIPDNYVEDITAPILKKVVYEKKEIETPCSVRISFEIEENESGSSTFCGVAYFKNEDGSYNEGITISNAIDSNYMVIENKFQAKLGFTRYENPGKIYLYKLVLGDKAGNNRTLTLDNNEIEKVEINVITDDTKYTLETSNTISNYIEQISNLQEGSTVLCNISNNKIIKKELFDAIKGRNITIIFEDVYGFKYDLKGIQWIINGMDIKNETKDVNMTINFLRKSYCKYLIEDYNFPMFEVDESLSEEEATKKLINNEIGAVKEYFKYLESLEYKNIDTYLKKTIEILEQGGCSARSAIYEATPHTEYLAIQFANNGELPGTFKVRIKPEYAIRNILGTNNLYLFYINGDEITEVMKRISLKQDDYYEFNIIHNSEYWMTKGNILSDNENLEEVLGDINGDGKVNTADFGLLNAHLRKKKLLEGEQLERADINGDGKVNTADFGLLNAHLRKKKLLW